MSIQNNFENDFIIFIDSMNDLLKSESSDVRLQYAEKRIWFTRDDERITFECLDRVNNYTVYNSDEDYYEMCKSMIKNFVAIILNDN